MEMINRDFTMEKQTHEDVVSSRHCDANGVVFISVNGKRRRLDDVYVINVNNVNDTKRKRIDDDDEIVSYKKRRILDIDEVDYEMVEAETRVERARMMADAEEKMQQQIKHQKQIIQLQNQYIKKQNSQKQNSQKQQDQNIQKQKQQQQRLKYKLKKQQQIQNAEWLRIQNKRREDAREKADYDDFIREKKRQQMVAYANVCAESEEFLAEQKRKRQILKVFENSNADDVICEQKRRRIIADRVADMKDFMYINQK